MKRLAILSAWMFFLMSLSYGQSIKTRQDNIDNNAELEKLWLLSDLQTLEAKSAKLGSPLARGLAKAEVADAAWLLEQTWAKKLLREAYESTLPNEEEQSMLRQKPVGAPPTIPSSGEIARNAVRGRILGIAQRDKVFADELAGLGAERGGKQKENYMYADLAFNSIATGDKEAAGNYILKGLDADPSIINAGFAILDIAAKDRPAADKLILQYIERLRTFTLSQANDSAFRVYFLLKTLMFPTDSSLAMKNILFKNSNSDIKSQQIAQASPAVIKAYVRYLIESLSELEQREPGSARRLHGYLLSAWLPLKQYAPELTGSFLELEKLSRRPGEDAALPSKSPEEANKEKYEKRLKESLDSDNPDELTINFAISRGDFDKARKLIEKLPDGTQKTQFSESVNTREAVALATKGDTLSALSLAERLNKATSMLQVYPLIINKCAARKDQPCAMDAFYRAVGKIKKADASPSAPPAGLPATIIPLGKEFDPVLMGLGKLAKAVLPASKELALDALDEMVGAANRSELDTGQGRIGFEADVFKLLAPKNEGRVEQAALNLKDALRQIVALAAIDQWKAKELTDKAKTVRKESVTGK
ncbi:MAG: hypothetical protein ABR577_14335 [Pyrinomonadaceae bacterium]